MHAIMRSSRTTGPGPLEPFDGRPPSAELTRADAIARFEDDLALFERIVPLFRQAAGDQVAALLEAVERGDAMAVRHWAHTLKGSLLTVGANATAGRAEEVERAALGQRPEALRAQVHRLTAETRTIVSHLSPPSR